MSSTIGQRVREGSTEIFPYSLYLGVRACPYKLHTLKTFFAHHFFSHYTYLKTLYFQLIAAKIFVLFLISNSYKIKKYNFFFCNISLLQQLYKILKSPPATLVILSIPFHHPKRNIRWKITSDRHRRPPVLLCAQLRTFVPPQKIFIYFIVFFFFISTRPLFEKQNYTIHANCTHGVPVRVSNAGWLRQEECGRVRDDQRRSKWPGQQVQMPGWVPVVSRRPQRLEWRVDGPSVSLVRPVVLIHLDNNHVYAAATVSGSEVQAT